MLSRDKFSLFISNLFQVAKLTADGGQKRQDGPDKGTENDEGGQDDGFHF